MTEFSIQVLTEKRKIWFTICSLLGAILIMAAPIDIMVQQEFSSESAPHPGSLSRLFATLVVGFLLLLVLGKLIDVSRRLFARKLTLPFSALQVHGFWTLSLAGRTIHTSSSDQAETTFRAEPKSRFFRIRDSQGNKISFYLEPTFSDEIIREQFDKFIRALTEPSG